MTATELWYFFQDNTGVSPTAFSETDADYALPAREWIAGDFARSLRDNLKALGLDSYVAERNDCDKFALYSCAFARICHMRSTQMEVGIAFGMVNYRKTDVGMHAINVAVVYEGGPKLVFFEPQTQQIVELSEAERKSIYAVYI